VFRRLLVANRGEIACRVIRTCRRLGIETVAVFSEADRGALHVEMADLAVEIGPAPVRESYLRIGRILEAARRTGAEAIHPGYGLLSENPAFARAVRDAGLVFVGPPPEAMELLGDKARAKKLAAEVGVPVVPGETESSDDLAQLAARARRMGVPLLVKAAAGGGGRGMRRVADPAEIEAALESAKREAEAAFGDGRLLLERWIERPRHVEVQVFGDAEGRIVHLFTRDCTVQRRHQKILEEAPAPFLPAETRAGLHEAAVRLARAAGYVNAGTVEFLVEPDGRFWFIEANTRLQVEHPVTEAVTGLDLVEWQIRIAAGEPLPQRQEDIAASGHAIEVRLCAEDPARGFLPSTGRMGCFDLPEEVRVDAGVRAGDVMTPHYDSLMAKLIAHGADRGEARARLLEALRRTRISGIATNRQLLARILRDPAFITLSLDTRWLDLELERLARPVEVEALLPDAVFATIAHRLATPEAPSWCEANSPWNLRDGFRAGLPARQDVVVEVNGRLRAITALRDVPGGAWRIVAGAREMAAAVRKAGGEVVLLEEPEGAVRRILAWVDGEGVEVDVDGERLALRLAASHEPVGEESAHERLITAPLPGRVVAVPVAPGQQVARGETVVVIEAMKMEQRLTAPHDGTVAAVHVRAGEQVQEGAVLVELEASQATEGAAPPAGEERA